MAREVSEWRGKHDDSMPPPRVRLRIFARENGVCYLSGRRIHPGEKWALDHRISIINGGENRESNLFPVLVDKHKEKTREDVAEKAKVAKKAKKHLGISKPKIKIQSRGFETGKPKSEKIPMPPRRSMFEEER